MKEPFLFSPPPPPSTFFFAPAVTSLSNLIGNACYAGYQNTISGERKRECKTYLRMTAPFLPLTLQIAHRIG